MSPNLTPPTTAHPLDFGLFRVEFRFIRNYAAPLSWLFFSRYFENEKQFLRFNFDALRTLFLDA